MPSVGGSGSRSTDPGGRQSSASKKGANSTSAGQTDARIARLASRGSGAANAKDDGMGEAARAHANIAQGGAATGSAAETSKQKKRVAPTASSSDEDGGLAAAGVVNVSEAASKLKKASRQPVHVFMYDCNTYLTHHSIFFAGNLEEYLRQTRPASPEHFARRAQGAGNPEQGRWPKQRCLTNLTVAALTVTVVTGPK